MKIVANCVIEPQKWIQFDVYPDKSLSAGTGFERTLDHVKEELAKESKARVTFWIRGDVLLVEEFGALEIKPQPPTRRFELKAKIEGLHERCFIVHLITGQPEWVKCTKEKGNHLSQ